MKKAIMFVLVLCMAFSLCGCQKTLKGTDALIEKARKEIPIANAANTDIAYVGLCGKDNLALIWFVSGNEYQAHYYLPMECTVVGENEYTFERICKPLERGMDIAVLQWQNGYSFLVNNPACKTIQITDDSGTQAIAIEKDAYPFIYYNEQIPSEYYFLDAEGNEIP